MRAGQATSWFTLQKPTGTSGSGYTAVIADLPGELRFQGGAEDLQAGAQVAVGQHVIVIRHRTDVRAEWRLLEQDTTRLFQIKTFGDPTGRRIDLKLLCEEIT